MTIRGMFYDDRTLFDRQMLIGMAPGKVVCRQACRYRGVLRTYDTTLKPSSDCR